MQRNGIFHIVFHFVDLRNLWNFIAQFRGFDREMIYWKMDGKRFSLIALFIYSCTSHSDFYSAHIIFIYRTSVLFDKFLQRILSKIKQQNFTTYSGNCIKSRRKKNHDRSMTSNSRPTFTSLSQPNVI